MSNDAAVVTLSSFLLSHWSQVQFTETEVVFSPQLFKSPSPTPAVQAYAAVLQFASIIISTCLNNVSPLSVACNPFPLPELHPRHRVVAALPPDDPDGTGSPAGNLVEAAGSAGDVCDSWPSRYVYLPSSFLFSSSCFLPETFFIFNLPEFSSKLVSNFFSPFLFLFSLYLVDNSLVDNDVEYYISVVASSNFIIIYFVAEVDVDEDVADVLFQKSLVAGSS